jgi:hypothetical protein
MTALAAGEVWKGLLYKGAEEKRPVFTDGKHRKLVFVDYWPEGNRIRCLNKMASESIHLILHVNQIPVSQLRKLKVWDLLPARTQIGLQTAAGKTS